MVMPIVGVVAGLLIMGLLLLIFAIRRRREKEDALVGVDMEGIDFLVSGAQQGARNVSFDNVNYIPVSFA